tara:strand:- start:2090 stop:2923 length:834 start_codon:yes stop_codon:yes gene_type:complete
MKNISKKSWFSLSIEMNDTINLDLLYAKFYNYIIGSTELNGQYVFYFESKYSNLIKNILDSKFSTYNFLIKNLHYENWHEKYQENFQTVDINHKLKIVPDWYEIDDDDQIDYIRIVPGMAFGTGHHETTQLIIKSLLDIIKPEFKILDLGAGSGILAIAALKFGASYVKAIEFDQDCEENFIENMNLNNIKSNYSLEINDALLNEDYSYDLVIANINKNVILDLLPNFYKHKENKFKIILSGLLTSDEKEVVKLLDKFDFKIINKLTMGEWLCLIIE